MFDNYSIADLFANIYKKRAVNAIAAILIFCIVAIPYTYKVVNSKTTVKDTTNYSSYVSYKITSPLEEQKNINKNQIGGYGDFYGKLIESNLNGAFLFNDLSSEDLKKISSELDTAATTLKSSNFDYWDKKIEVNPLVNNAGVSIKILTPSKLTNDIIERKLDGLIEKFKNTYTNVTIEKLDTVNSQELIKTESSKSGVNKISLLLRLAILAVAAIVIILLSNLVLYIFNPTINRASDYSRYGINFIMKLNSVANFKEIVQYKNGNNSLVILGSNKRIVDKFSKDYGEVLSSNITICNLEDIKYILDSDSILFIEEYGITRYKNFEESLQVIKNLNKKVMGVVTYKL